MKFAVLADIHGNSDALRAVLADMADLAIGEAVNLGDHFSGPLDAAGTADLLIGRAFPSIRGNHDRLLIEQSPDEMGPSDKVAFDQLSQTHLGWVADLPSTRQVFGEVFMCHGTPRSDQTYWLERVDANGVIRSASLDEVEVEAEGIKEPLILCAHTHIPRVVRIRDGRMVLNPGSVGCPAYDDDQPVYHQMQTGTPNASYAIVEKTNRGNWTTSFRSVPYETSAMVERARQNGRDDWERAVRTGWFDT